MGGVEDVAFGESVPEPRATGAGDHDLGDDLTTLTIAQGCNLLLLAYGLAIAGVRGLGHQCTV